jgi:hypothetical protein
METKPTLTVNITDLQQVLNDAEFDNTDQIREIIIPETFLEIDIDLRDFIDMCENLEGFNVHPDNPVFSSESGILFNKDKTELIFCSHGLAGDYSIPNHVTKIKHGAFNGCVKLASITIPNTITEIEDGTFDGCIHLSEVEIPDSVTKIGEYAFSECFSLVVVSIPKSTIEISENAFSGCCFGLPRFVVHPDNPIYASKDGELINKNKVEEPDEKEIAQSKSWTEVLVGLDFEEIKAEKPLPKEKHLIVTMGSTRPPEFSSHAEMKAKELLDLFARSNEDIRIIDVIKTTHYSGGAERILDSLTSKRGYCETKITYTYDPNVEYTARIIDVLRASGLFANIEEKDVEI